MLRIALFLEHGKELAEGWYGCHDDADILFEASAWISSMVSNIRSVCTRGTHQAHITFGIAFPACLSDASTIASGAMLTSNIVVPKIKQGGLRSSCPRGTVRVSKSIGLLPEGSDFLTEGQALAE